MDYRLELFRSIAADATVNAGPAPTERRVLGQHPAPVQEAALGVDRCPPLVVDEQGVRPLGQAGLTMDPPQVLEPTSPELPVFLPALRIQLGERQPRVRTVQLGKIGRAHV